jgi:hypothetical protein
MQTLYVLHPKSHFHIPSLRSFVQKIHPVPRLFMTSGNKLVFLNKGFLVPTPKPQAGGPLLVVFPRLHIQYIRSYPPVTNKRFGNIVTDI